MATIETRTGGNDKKSYRAKVRIQGQPVHTKTFSRKTDAVKWSKAIETDLERGHYVPTKDAEKRTVADLIDRYINDTLPNKSRNKDYKKVASLLKWWRAEIGIYSITKVTPATIGDCRDKLARQKTIRGEIRSPATVNRYLAAMSGAFTTAVREWYWMLDSPMRNVQRKTEPKGRTRFLSDDERKRLLKECKSSKNADLYTIVVLALSTGARQGEIYNLTWKQVDFKNNKITLHDTKNGETRVLPLHGHAFNCLKDRIKIRSIDSNRLFDGEFRKAWNYALKRAEINGFKFHDLRHTAASYLAMNGATLAEIADILGHKTLQMVKRYSHLTEQHTSKIVEKMNKQIF